MTIANRATPQPDASGFKITLQPESPHTITVLDEQYASAAPFAKGAPLGIEHRQGRRTHLVALVTIVARDEHYSGAILNVSANGMYVLTDTRFRENECVDIRIQHPQARHAALCYPGLVIHNHGNGFGMLFRELGSDAEQQLAWWLNEK